jgi:hypothetical protein
MDGVLFIVMVINPLPYERTNKCLVDSEMVINPLPYERGGSRTKMMSLCDADRQSNSRRPSEL